MALLRHILLYAGSGITVFGSAMSMAQTPTQPPSQTAQPQPVQPQPSVQPNGEWEKLPRMRIERQYAGPLRDTVIQRLRDPIDGTVCYIYLPITAPHSPIQSTGFVQYGSNTIGTMNCLPPQTPSPRAASPRPAGRPTAATSDPAAAPIDRKP